MEVCFWICTRIIDSIAINCNRNLIRRLNSISTISNFVNLTEFLLSSYLIHDIHLVE